MVGVPDGVPVVLLFHLLEALVQVGLEFLAELPVEVAGLFFAVVVPLRKQFSMLGESAVGTQGVLPEKTSLWIDSASAGELPARGGC